MKNPKERSEEEIRKIILEQLDDQDIESDFVEMEIAKGPKVLLKGEVSSKKVREMIKQIIVDSTGIEDIVDRLIVPDDTDDDDDLRDEDGESMGTEDAFQSIEDGVPYVPPTDHEYREYPENKKRKKKKK
ncbi:MAG: BON domain-containing protein [Candidatus Omnitrophica bacterium]|nr:BON domain-containing protein [Candidatus Omnitrophota bacterium]